MNSTWYYDLNIAVVINNEFKSKMISKQSDFFIFLCLMIMEIKLEQRKIEIKLA